MRTINTLISFVYFLQVFGQTTIKTTSTTDHNDAHCIWRGICEGEKKNCAYNGTALPLNDTGVKELKEWCSHLLPNDYPANKNVLTCCDINQVIINIIFMHIKNHLSCHFHS